MNQQPLTEHVCPTCGAVHDAATGVDTQNSPTDGDSSFCMKCGGLAVFVITEDSTSLRALTDAEHLQAMADPQIRQVTRLWREAKISQGRRPS